MIVTYAKGMKSYSKRRLLYIVVEVNTIEFLFF